MFCVLKMLTWRRREPGTSPSRLNGATSSSLLMMISDASEILDFKASVITNCKYCYDQQRFTHNWLPSSWGEIGNGCLQHVWFTAPIVCVRELQFYKSRNFMTRPRVYKLMYYTF